MYVPSAFRQSSEDELFGLVEHYPFATLVAITASGLLANHQPMVLHRDEGSQGLLRGHLARGNALVDDALEGADVLAIFQGPSAYISPSWYPSKAEHGKVVPTWNFAAVHCQAVLRFQSDSDWLLTHLSSLTQMHEQGLPEPWSVDDAPAHFIDTMMRGIVGIELELKHVEGKWKLGQNRADADRVNVERVLANESDSRLNAVAELMRATRTQSA
jgi:transcriptional regulator